MLVNFFYTLIALIALGLYSITNSYTNELVFLDDGKTIKELKENIKTLDKINVELNNELETLNADYKLKTFLRKDLSVSEFRKIRKIVSIYNLNKLTIEENLRRKAEDFISVIDEKKLLLEEKRKLYSGLIPFIDTVFKNEYLKYIEGDAKIFNEQKNIATNIISKQQIINIKVEGIEEKIKEHKDYINESIKKIIETKLEEKINNLEQNETFNILNIESKIKVLDKTIRKIKIKLKNLEVSKIKINPGIIKDTNSSVLDKKIQTYYIAVEKLEKFRENIK